MTVTSPRSASSTRRRAGPGDQIYFIAVKSARLALARLEDNLADRYREKGAVLRAHLAEHYGYGDRS